MKGKAPEERTRMLAVTTAGAEPAATAAVWRLGILGSPGSIRWTQESSVEG